MASEEAKVKASVETNGLLQHDPDRSDFSVARERGCRDLRNAIDGRRGPAFFYFLLPSDSFSFSALYCSTS